MAMSLDTNGRAMVFVTEHPRLIVGLVVTLLFLLAADPAAADNQQYDFVSSD